MTKTRTTKQLSNALAQIKAEAITRIGLIFKGKFNERLTFSPEQAVHINHLYSPCLVNEIDNAGRVFFTFLPKRKVNSDCMLLDLEADSLLCILDEIERMKQSGNIKK